MKKRSLYVLAILCLSLLLISSTVWGLAKGKAGGETAVVAAAADEQLHAVTIAVNWLVENHQNDDGGYSNFSSGANQAPSGASGTLDAVLAIAAAGYNPAANYPEKSSNPITYMQNSVADVAAYAQTGGGPAGKVILGLTAASQNPRDFMGYNFVISLTSQLSPTGQYNATTAYNQSLALLALAAVNETVPASATQWLKDQQAGNGSWDDGFGTTNNADATGIAIMALVAQGESPTGTPLQNAKTFLSGAQLTTGGWEYGTGLGENANSTALVVQALSALGEDFYATGSAWDQGGNTPLSALLSYQNTTGAFQADFGFGPFDDFFSTTQSIAAAAGRAYPLLARYEAAREAIACLATLQDTATGGWEQFAGFGINAAGTSRAIEAIAAFGDDPQSGDWTPGSVNAVAALENLTPAYLAGGRGGRVGVVMQGVVVAGSPYSVTSFAGYNLPISVTGYLSPTGEYADTSFGPISHNEAMLGLLAADLDPDSSAVAWLQNAAVNGSWGGGDSDGSSINVLGQMGEELPNGAIANLHNTQQSDAGWGFGIPASVNSTSEVVQGLNQNGYNPFDPTWSVVISGTIQNPADVIMQQQGTNGCWPNLYGPGDDPYSTTDGILLLMTDPAWRQFKIYMPLISKP